MIHRVRRSGSGARSALARRLLLVVLCGAANACGSGDDSLSVAPPLVDAGVPLDATVTKDAAAGGGDAAHPDAGADATVHTGGAVAKFALGTIDVGSVACSASGTKTLAIANMGTGVLTVSASAVGSAFAVSPTTLSVPPAGSGTLTITASVPGSSTAGTPLVGSLNLFTNDPAQPSVPLALSATPTGATIVDLTGDTMPSVNFASSGLGQAATPKALILKNVGNAPASLTLGTPSAPQFSLVSPLTDAGGQTVNAGASLTATFDFTPTDTNTKSATSSVQVTGVTCGPGATISLNGRGAVGAVTGYPTAPIDFGPVECGGSMPTPQLVTLTNTGAFDAHVTLASVVGPPGFTTSAAVGNTIPAQGGTLQVAFTAPPVAATSALTPITATVSLQTDADATPQTLTLTETPTGAILAFDTTQDFGSFGTAVLLQSVAQPFNVKNTGNEAANVTLTATSAVAPGPGAPSAFTLSNGAFSIAAAGTQADSATYGATAIGAQTAVLRMRGTGVNGGLCSPLPSAKLLSGSGIGGGPSVAPTSLAFNAPCGGPAPAAQSFTVSNNGTANLTWSMGAVTGPGAAGYAVSATPAPGVLEPGASATVTVSAAAVPAPAVNPSPAAYAASIAITTDVPFDDPHVVALGVTPLGDQLSFSTGLLKFGQFPVNTTTLAETFTITNAANVGSPAANLSLSLAGIGASGYAATPSVVTNLAPGGVASNPIGVTFDPPTAATYPATLGITTTDGQCTALPAPIGLVGTGTQAKVSVSATTLAFGTDAGDSLGLVNCGATGLPRTFTVSNAGNQAFHITGLTLGQGANSPYVLSGPGSVLPFTVPIHGNTSITITPNPIPAAVANPNDVSPFADTLTVTTDAALDSPHPIALVMQARGAVIADTTPTGTWNFGMVGAGSIGTFANTITNSGNAAVSIALSGLKQPAIFGLQNNPTMAAPNAVTAVIGQFSPPSANGQWNDQGTLVVTPVQALCEPLPSGWTHVPVVLAGSSNGDPSVTIAGTLTFPSSDCGSAAPAGRAITLTNGTNVPYAFSTAFGSGAFYTATLPGDAGSGSLPAKGMATILVTPKTVTPGPGVSAGSAPYVDDLVITVMSSPPSTFTVPISWTLNGAVLALPDGLGPNRDAMGHPFYAADTGSGLVFPMANTGTAGASVSFGVQPAGAFSVSPTGPIPVQPGILALPRLASAAGDAACPALTAGSVTFLYAGPVCQPFAASKVTLQSCVGTF